MTTTTTRTETSLYSSKPFTSRVADILDQYRTTRGRLGQLKAGSAGQKGLTLPNKDEQTPDVFLLHDSPRQNVKKGVRAVTSGEKPQCQASTGFERYEAATAPGSLSKIIAVEDILSPAQRKTVERDYLASQREAGVTPSGVWDPYGFHPQLHATPNSQTTVLTIQNYSSILVADEPQTLFVILLNKSLPSFPLFAQLGNNVIPLKLIGGTLLAQVPPQQPGEIFLTLTAGVQRDVLDYSDAPIIQFRMAHQDTASGPFLSALPITVIRPPAAPQEPRLAYSTNASRKSAVWSCATSSRTKYSAYDETDLAQMMAASMPQAGNLARVPAAKGCRVDLRAQSSRTASKKRNAKRETSVWKRLESLQSGGWQHQWNETDWGSSKTAAVELQLALAALDVSLVNAIIPFFVRASIYHSVPPLNRKSINLFHQRIFQLHPFNICSVHLFTKSRPNGPYTIFGFSLSGECSPEDLANSGESASSDLPLTFTAALERFETTDRACCDPRLWTYIDAAVPSKNKAAEGFRIEQWGPSLLSAPTPPRLHRTQHIHCYGTDAQRALEIAPEVFLHWEPWPTVVLPNQLDSHTTAPSSEPHHPSTFGIVLGDFPSKTTTRPTATTTFETPITRTPLSLRVDKENMSTLGQNATSSPILKAAKSVTKVEVRKATDKVVPTENNTKAATEKTGSVGTKATLDRVEELESQKSQPKVHSPLAKNSQTVTENEENRSKTTSVVVEGGRTSPRTAGKSYHTKPLNFGVTLCVGKYVYTSVTAVSSEFLEFIINDWLRRVPPRNVRPSPSSPLQPDIPFPSLLGTSL